MSEAGSGDGGTFVECSDNHATVPNSGTKLSYKFQRLREKLRAAVTNGELAGKLPGERQLARRFRVNAKTLSKALTDLAAEGLLERSIGRGTFVKGAATHQPAGEKWLIICDPEQTSAKILEMLQEANPQSQIVTGVSGLRPSFLNQFRAVINFSWTTPDEFIRSLILRNMNVVMLNRELRQMSTHAVREDFAPSIWSMVCDMVLAGHRQFSAIDKPGHSTVIHTMAKALRHYEASAAAESADPAGLPAAIERGVSAIICAGLPLARESRRVLDHHSIDVPGRVSMGAIGAGLGEYPCSGFFVHARDRVEAITQILSDQQLKRPTTLWLRGTYHDQGTIGPPPRTHTHQHAPHLPAFRQLSA
jgi:DNA-binding transcriptional regulator YhcF (GntR family)